MIKIKRYAPEELGVDEKLIEKLFKETEAAKIHYAAELEKLKADQDYKIESFSFSAYGKTKPDLIEVYKGKCAYCEASILHGQPGDVEHFRPKSAIDSRIDGIENLSSKVKPPVEEEHKIKPGYYWLAADWYNLLLSCNACNRSSKQLNAAKNTGVVITNETLEKETLGKGTRFPYADVKKRIGDPLVKISKEKHIRLLLDPGEDDPEEHLTFTKHTGRKNTLFETDEIETEEKFGMIQAKSDKGIASIQIFGLARLTLVQEREKAALNIMSILTDLGQAVTSFVTAQQRLRATPADDFAILISDQNRQIISDKMKSLTDQFKNSSTLSAPSQYLGMKRVILKNWLEEENSFVKELKDLNIDLERLLILDIINDLNFIRRLTKDFIGAGAANDTKKKNLKKKVLKKVWKSLKKEYKDGSDYLVSKKSLLNAWIKNMESRNIEVLDTLATMNIDPKVLLE